MPKETAPLADGVQPRSTTCNNTIPPFLRATSYPYSAANSVYHSIVTLTPNCRMG